MKQEAASQHQDGPGVHGGTAADPAGVQSAQRPLTSDEVRVLRCLQEARGGLTASQLEARAACSGEALERVLATLLERRLAARLNTIIPSFAAKSTGAPIDGR